MKGQGLDKSLRNVLSREVGYILCARTRVVTTLTVPHGVGVVQRDRVHLA